MRFADSELEGWLRDGESEFVEFKRSFSDKDDIRKAICAFANDLTNAGRPGVVFVGVEDDGSCTKLDVHDRLLRELADLRSDGKLLPFPILAVEKRTIGGCELAIAVVEPSDAPPVRFNGRCYVSVGSSRRTATPAEETRLSEKRRFKNLPFDLRPVDLATRDEYDLELFHRRYLPSAVAPEVIEQNERTLEQKLIALRLLAPDGTPTVLGCLTLAREPVRILPCAYVQFLRIAGATLTDPPKDEETITGPLPDLLSRLDEKLAAHVTTEVDFVSGKTETRRASYPLVALQQLVRNAILHRTYESTNNPVRVTWFDDRIEIVSPGGVFGVVTPDTFGDPGVCDYRNPHLAEVMKNLGYVQKFGIGIALARSELRKNGNPDLVLDPQPHFVRCVVRIRNREP